MLSTHVLNPATSGFESSDLSTGMRAIVCLPATGRATGGKQGFKNLRNGLKICTCPCHHCDRWSSVGAVHGAGEASFEDVTDAIGLAAGESTIAAGCAGDHLAAQV